MNTGKHRDRDLAISELKLLLSDILNSRGGKKNSLVLKFEDKLNSYWEQHENLFDDNMEDILSDLLGDFAYYQSNPVIRFFGKGLLGDKELDEAIKRSLDKIEKLKEI